MFQIVEDSIVSEKNDELKPYFNATSSPNRNGTPFEEAFIMLISVVKATLSRNSDSVGFISFSFPNLSGPYTNNGEGKNAGNQVAGITTS